jgi:hypothetical protein
MKVYFVGYITALVALLIFDTAAYDLTNLATLRGWPWPLTVGVVDLAWGRRRDGDRGGFPGDARRLKDQCSSLYSG